jgi:hypothetical protein
MKFGSTFKLRTLCLHFRQTNYYIPIYPDFRISRISLSGSQIHGLKSSISRIRIQTLDCCIQDTLFAFSTHCLFRKSYQCTASLTLVLIIKFRSLQIFVNILNGPIGYSETQKHKAENLMSGSL